MAKNDLRVLMYKVLRYLYACNQEGKAAALSDLLKVIEYASIPRSYLAQVLRELVDGGYIKGCRFISTKDGVYIDLAENAYITVAGVEYLEENSSMQKVRSAVEDTFSQVLGAVISQAVAAVMPGGR